MAITHFLLQPNFNSIHLHPTKWSSRINHNNIAFKRNYTCRCIKTSPKFNMKCFMMNKKSEEEDDKVGAENGIKGVSWISMTMENVIKTLQVSIITTGVLLFLCGGRMALAASGGRVGGRCRGRSSSGGRSSRSHARSYSSSSGTLTGNPATEEEFSPKDTIIVFGSITLFCFVTLILDLILKMKYSQKIAKTCVLKLQVGSLGTGRLLQKDLNRIADSADTSSSKGLHNVLQETISALLRHSEYYISGYSSVDVTKSVSECEKQLDQLSIEERGKFDEETLVNVDNIKKKSTSSQSSNGLPNEYIVVTIIVAAHDVLELPPIESSEQLKNALEKLASIPSSNLVGVEVLWTPQKEDDSLTEQEMLEDYPLLHTF